MTSRWLNYSKTPVSTVIYTTGNSTIDSNLTAGDGILISDTRVISNVLTVRDGELSQNNLSNERLLAYEGATQSVDDILTGDARSMEGFAKGRKISFKEKKYRGESRVGEAEVRLENEADAYREQMAEEADEFAKGGLAGQLL